MIEPSSGKIAEGDTITITFPFSMVPPTSSMLVTSQARLLVSRSSTARFSGKVRLKAFSR